MIRALSVGTQAQTLKGGKLSLSLLMSGSKARLQKQQACVDKACPRDVFLIFLPFSVLQMVGNYFCLN